MSRLRCLHDFMTADLDAIAECKACGRRVRVDPRKLLAALKVHWRKSLDYEGSKLKCSACGKRGARLAPVPKIVGPLDCEQFRDDIRRVWERVMAEQEDRSFVIEGPDGDGIVWICSAEGRDDWCQSLGTLAEVAEVMSEWLGAVDYLERE